MPISYSYDPTPPIAQAKSTADILDYTLSWQQEFGPGGGSPGDSITVIDSISASPSGSLQVASATVVLSNQAVLFWAVSGIPGQTYTVSVSITTQGHRTYTRELLIPVAADV